MVLRGVYRFLCILVAALFPIALRADMFEIMDAEGFDRKMVAKTVQVPKGWQTSGRIAWNKPCSSNDLFETIFLTQSPDGRAGARIMPGYQFLEDKAAVAPGAIPDQMTYLILSQSEGFNREMASNFRGSNCAVGAVADTETILKAVVLRNRPSETRLVSVQRDREGFQALSASFGGGLPGVQLTYDALIVEMEYARGGVPTTEWLFLSWYNLTQEPMDMGGVISSSSHTIVEPLRLVWAPTNQARALLPKITRIFSSMRSAPDWQRRIDDIYRENAKVRRKAQAERDAESERRTREFIDQNILEGPGGGSIGPVAGVSIIGSDTAPATVVSEPETATGEKKEETDFWGNSIEEKNFQGGSDKKEN